MSEVKPYPRMLYKDGQVGADRMVVDNAGEEAAAGREGYFRAGAKPETVQAKSLASTVGEKHRKGAK